jgi:hypothetical protein
VGDAPQRWFFLPQEIESFLHTTINWDIVWFIEGDIMIGDVDRDKDRNNIHNST